MLPGVETEATSLASSAWWLGARYTRALTEPLVTALLDRRFAATAHAGWVSAIVLLGLAACAAVAVTRLPSVSAPAAIVVDQCALGNREQPEQARPPRASRAREIAHHVGSVMQW